MGMDEIQRETRFFKEEINRIKQAIAAENDSKKNGDAQLNLDSMYDSKIRVCVRKRPMNEKGILY